MQIAIDTQTLIDIVKVNLATHTQEYEEAVVGWQEKELERLQKQVADFISDGKPVGFHHGLPRPVSHEKDYNRIIGMLELRMRGEPPYMTTITESEYAKYVQDDWEWKADFVSNTSSYKTG